MRRALLFVAAVAFIAGPLVRAPLHARQGAPQSAGQQQPPQPTPGVRVGVPQGRGGAPAPGIAEGRGPAGPAPRNAAGRVILGGPTPAVKGVWLPGAGGAEDTGDNTPLQPGARALLANRSKFQLEPHTRCKPSGGIRQFLTPYGVEFVELTELQRVFIFDIGGPHTSRTIYIDGRSHPADFTPSFYGHSIGWWEGDTLNVETTGFNEGFWIDRRGLPTTEKLRTLEKFTRTDSLTIAYELTIDDPGAYTAPWTTKMNLRWEDGTELFEYVCQQANYAHNLMLGAY